MLRPISPSVAQHGSRFMRASSTITSTENFRGRNSVIIADLGQEFYVLKKIVSDVSSLYLLLHESNKRLFRIINGW